MGTQLTPHSAPRGWPEGNGGDQRGGSSSHRSRVNCTGLFRPRKGRQRRPFPAPPPQPRDRGGHEEGRCSSGSRSGQAREPQSRRFPTPGCSHPRTAQQTSARNRNLLSHLSLPGGLGPVRDCIPVPHVGNTDGWLKPEVPGRAAVFPQQICLQLNRHRHTVS